MSQQNTKKDGTNLIPVLSVSREKSLQNLYHNMILSRFYDNLSSKAKQTHLNFKTKKQSMISKSEIARQIKETLEIQHGIGQRQQKSPHKAKSVLLPALQYKKHSQKYQNRLIINETIFIHERIPLRVNHKNELNAIKKSKTITPSTLFVVPNPEARLSNRRKGDRKSAISRLKDLQVIEMSMREVDRSPMQAHNSVMVHHKSNQKMSKIQNDQVYQYPISNTSRKLRIRIEEIPPAESAEAELMKKKSKVERMILYYRIKRQREEERVKSQKCLCSASETYEEMQKIKVKGQQTTYCTKESPKRESPRRDRSCLQMPKPKYSGWKTREFPITQLSRVQAGRLFAYYLSIREVVPIASGNYKVYLGEGNNGQLVGRLLKNKGWWAVTEDIAEAHLVWTQHPQEEWMGRTESFEGVRLRRDSVCNFLIPENQAWEKEVELVERFLKLKGNHFLEGCGKLLHPIVYHRTMTEIVDRFKQNRYVKHFASLRDAIGHYLLGEANLRLEAKSVKVYNHCEHAEQIGDKKNLLLHIQKYCQLNQIDKNKLIPRTLHINQQQIEVLKGAGQNQQLISGKLGLFSEQQALYILKPGQCSNRGNGITIHPTRSALVQHISKSLINFPESKTYIVQQYIDPLLYEGRKFDIRIWVLYANNKLWFYREGYIRTSCREYTTKSMNKFVHLTNDAVQKNAEEYGRFEPANKVSFHEMDKYLKKAYGYSGFYSQIYVKMKNLTKILFEAGMLVLGRTSPQFQLFGLDFLIDRRFDVWLIECNTNPSIEICCSLLNRLVPNMLENLMSVVVDPYFPPSERKVVREEGEWAGERFNFQLLSDAALETSYLGRVTQDLQYFQHLYKLNPFKLELVRPQNTA